MTPQSSGEREHPGTWKVAAPTLISVVRKASSGKQTEIHRNAPGSQFRQQEGRAQQYIEVLLKYHRLGNNLHPNHWGKGRQNSDGRASMDAPPKKMQTGKFSKHSGKPMNPTASSLETILDRPEKGTTKWNPRSSFPIEHDRQRVTAATPTRNAEASSQGLQ